MTIFNKKLNKKYIDLIVILILLFVGFFVQNVYLSYIFTIIICAIIFFSGVEEAFGLSIMLLPLSGIYDSSGFLHLYNFGLISFTSNLIIKTIYKKKITLNLIDACLVVLLLITYDLINASFNDVLNFHYINNCSIWFGYFAIIFMSKYIKFVNPKKIYLYFFLGFVFSCILCLLEVYMKWGFKVPSVYRFVGLLRDPNYFAFATVILLFSSLYLFQGKIKLVYFFTTLIFGALSVSKMFLVLLAIGLILYIFFYIFMVLNNKKINIKFLAFLISISLLGIFTLQVSGLMNLILNKYLYRFTAHGLTTGRDYIQGTFLDIIFSDINVALFGKSLDYNMIYKVAYADSDAMVAHNTYLDLIMSFGLIGTLLYLFIFVKIFYLYSTNIHLCVKSFILILIYLATLFVLSYLKADNFSISILFLLISLKKSRDEVIIYEYKSTVKNVCCNA